MPYKNPEKRKECALKCYYRMRDDPVRREQYRIKNIPCSWFNLEDPNQQRDCFNYRNLQPMWGLENISKNGRVAA